MVKNIINNSVFRIFTPIFYGVTMYILILLIFDRVQDLSENFLIIELVLCLIITYTLFESVRIFILLVEKKISDQFSISKRLLIQGGGSLLISVVITSFLISFYFSKLVGFSSYKNELIVFNTIFLLTTVLYNMIYFSFFYLNKTNESLLEKEDILRKNVEIELDTYKNKINPGFLYDSLETLISLSKQDIDKADQFILKLSSVYRNILSAKNSELVHVDNELKLVDTLIDIFNFKLNNNLSCRVNKKTLDSNIQLISGTLVVVIEDIVNRTVISELQPLIIDIIIDDELFVIQHPIRNKLIQEFSKQTEIDHLKKAYREFGDNEFDIIEESKNKIYKIPIFKLED